ncbi:hypothetical protein A2V49_04135 [candidate division WWE3 bacterium RBG_19FT_COMBO_34_6]|uniref:Undecaprenyl-diphosphatase n=1 Tax=candidate division WWE3 bacterium RBG_19FT_COMBO_34_6 TaxID=1802612 RepID=A0A1F4ULP0_UNCKA|nr:MAG: hypothetical protein A2V49_04135 [candidate division WWE3 bacterium RBG_19FT_COMBO_34_6]
MSFFQAIFFGAIQALTEFLPISSSGHLVLLHKFFGLESQSLAFDTTLHLGTAFALIIYFYKELFLLINNKSLLVKICLGSIPAGVIGVLLENIFEQYFRGVASVAFFLICGSILMILAEYFYKKVWVIQKLSDINNLSLKKSFIVGIFQSLALFPGISRSGATISSGMIFGLTREVAAKFSFLLSIPIIFAAGFFQLTKSYQEINFDLSLFGGFLASFFVGIIVVNFLLKYLKTHDLRIFIIYRIILAIILLLFFV